MLGTAGWMDRSGVLIQIDGRIGCVDRVVTRGAVLDGDRNGAHVRVGRLRDLVPAGERDIFIDNLLVRNHLITAMALVDWPCAMGD